MVKKSINHGLPDLDIFLEGRARKFVTYAEGSDMYWIPYYSLNRNVIEMFRNVPRNVNGNLLAKYKNGTFRAKN